MKLKQVASVTLHPKAPHNFDYSVHDPSHYPVPVIKYKTGKLWFSLRYEGKLLGIKFVNEGTVSKPKIKCSVYSRKQLGSDAIENLLGELGYRFQLGKPSAEFYQKFKDDELIGDTVKKLKGMRNFCIEGLYEYLMIAILLQNANIKRTVQMTNAMLENYGDEIEFDGQKLYAIWTPKKLLKASGNASVSENSSKAKVSEQELRALKVGYRAKNFLRASKDFLELDQFTMRRLNDGQLRKKLLDIYGVGPASVDYIMKDVFHRDVLETIPPWEAKVFSKLLDLDTKKPDEIMALLDKRYGKWKNRAISILFMDAAWRHEKEGVAWLEKLLPFSGTDK